ncbi:dentin sialophosphoprotein-like [Liolophura sinensis]|uniref:dentin sialophosphoprotein-like n=1 Tax=Liolophura sinensis TaxID=3198878 RepID=UPI00315880AC
MSSVNDERNIKQKLIDEVSRVQTSNLRRVESSSGMKTIFSSADYQNTLSQPKPQFGVRRNNNAHKGHHAHKTPPSPGKSRVRPKHNEHKAITADLFERNNNHKDRSEVNSFIPPDEPLATSTLKPEANTSNRTASTEDHDYHFETILQNSKTVSSAENGITATTSTFVETERNGTVSDTTPTGTFSTGMKQHERWEENTKSFNLPDQTNTNVTSERAETEMALPDDKIQSTSVGMSTTESTLSEEDEAIQELLDIAQGQESEMKETELKETSFQSDQNHNASPSEIMAKTSLTEMLGNSRFETETSDVEHSEETVEMAHRNSYGFTFDLNDIISSTPQAGSTCEGNSTPSDRGSVYSGSDPRFDRGERVTSSQASNRNSAQSDAGQEELVLTEATHIESVQAGPLDTEIQSPPDRETPDTDKGVLVTHDADISHDDQEVDKKREPDVTSDDNGINDSDHYDPDLPSQVEIDETHRRFDQMLADLSTSFEEDFTTTEKSVGRQLSSDAEVIVHSVDDHVAEPAANYHAKEADTAQEFTDLESSIISVPDEAVTSDISDFCAAAENQKLQRMSTASNNSSSSHANRADTSDDNVEYKSRAASSNFESQNTSLTNAIKNKLTRQVSGGSASQQDASGEFMDLETSQYHVDDSGSFHTDTKMSFSAGGKQELESRGSSAKQNIEHSFSELNSSFHKQIGKMDDKVIYSEIPPRSHDSSPRNSRGEAANVAVNTAVYSEAYQIRQYLGTPQDSASDNSLLYESIRDDTNSSNDVRENLSESASSGNKTQASGRLSPLGAEVSDAGGKSSWNSETYTVGGGNTALRVTSSQTTDTPKGSMATRSVPYGSEKVADSSFLPRTPRPFGFNKNKSEFQTLSESVNVKGLAKQLEKSLDFSRMLRSPGNSAEEKRADKDTHISSSKKTHVKSQDPKDAFGMVLSEIFRRNRLKSVEDEDEYNEKKDFQTPSESNIVKNNAKTQVNRDGENAERPSERTGEVSPQNASAFSESPEDLKTSEQISVEGFKPESILDRETSPQYPREDQSSLEVSSVSDTESHRNSLKEEDSAGELSVSTKGSVPSSPRGSESQEPVYVADILYINRDGKNSPHDSVRNDETHSHRESLNQEHLNMVNSVNDNINGTASSQESTRQTLSYRTESVRDWKGGADLSWERNESMSDRSEHSRLPQVSDSQERSLSESMKTCRGVDTTDSSHRSGGRKVSVESLSSEHTDIVTETVETVLPRSVERKVSVESLSSDHTDIVTETVETVLPKAKERNVSVKSLSPEHTDIVTETVETVLPRSVERKTLSQRQ